MVFLIPFTIGLAAALLYGAFNTTLQTSFYAVSSEKIPDSFDGFKIIQLSDLHSCKISGLLECIQHEKPDCIVCTGDIFDGIQPWNETLSFLKKCSAICDVYLVSGNHEKYRKDWDQIQLDLMQEGIVVLDNQRVPLCKGDDCIWLYGLEDPGIQKHTSLKAKLNTLQKSIRSLKKPEGYSVLLFHRASLFDEIKSSGFDLVLSGHIHGGQWRIFNQGIAGPGNEKRVDLFPKYDAGLYTFKDTKLIVSRGLGDQMKIPRIFNRPDLVSITLYSKRKKMKENWKHAH